MPIFEYTARDSTGQPSSGTMEADNELQLRQMLRQGNLYLTRFKKEGGSERGADQVESLKPLGEGLQATLGGRSTVRTKKVKPTDLVVMARLLSTLFRVGVPITEVIETAAMQTQSPVLKEILLEIYSDVQQGISLSQSMRKHPKVFNTLMIAMIQAGESAGTLDETLETIAVQLDKEFALQRQVKSAMVYPKIVVLACIGTIAGMMLLVVPAFKEVYAGFKADLPGPTLMLIAVSDFMTSRWYLLLGAIFLIVRAFKSYYASETGRRTVDPLLLSIPIFGEVIRKISIARYVQTLSGCVKGGIPILKSLTISAETAGNWKVEEAARNVVPRISEGQPLADELARTNVFPVLVTRMIAAGEKSGELDLMLEEVNKYYERDVDYSVSQMAKVIEPSMTVVIGLIVMVILLALYMPIFNLGQLMKDR